MRRGRVAGYGLVFLELLCHVQCQRSRVDQTDTNVGPTDIRAPDPGTTSNVGNHFAHGRPTATPTTTPLTPPPALRGNVVFNNFNAKEEVPDWTHELTVDTGIDIYEFEERVGESEKLYIQNALMVFKNTLQYMDFEFLNPRGLRISIPDGNTKITIFRFYIKLNEVVDETVGDFATSTNRTVGGWAILAPELQVEPGDEVHYQIHALLDKEQLYVKVDGVLGIKGESLRVNGSKTEVIQYCPIKGTSLWHEAHKVHQLPLSHTVTWNHRFTIDPTYPGGFTKNSARTWIGEMQRLKRILEVEFYLEVVNTTGVTIIIPVKYDTILEFNIKVGEKFHVLDSGDYVGNFSRGLDGSWQYYYPTVIANNGDTIHYWMRIIFGLQLDFTVQGELKVTQENSYTRHSKVGLDSVEFCPMKKEMKDVACFQYEHQLPITIQRNSNKTLTMEQDAEGYENAQSLGQFLVKNIQLAFFYPSGFRITISGGDNNFNTSVLNIRLDEQFKGSDYELRTANITEVGYNRRAYYYPNLKVDTKLNIYFSMRVIFGEEIWDSIVTGVIEVTGFGCTGGFAGGGGPAVHVKPTIRVRSFKSRPSKIIPSTFVGVLPGGTVEGVFRWSNQFTITAASDASFTADSTKKWLEDAKKLKTMLENDLSFQIVNTTSLLVSIPGNNGYYRANDFNIKFNGDLKDMRKITNEDKYIYSYAELELKIGDKIEYFMSLSLITHNFRGQLEITDIHEF